MAQWLENLPANAGDPGSIPGLGRSPGERQDNPLQYSCLDNPMGRGALSHGLGCSLWGHLRNTFPATKGKTMKKD